MRGQYIAVWGVGHIGLTTLMSLSNAGYRGIAVDVNKDVIGRLKSSNNLLTLLDEYYCDEVDLNLENIIIDAYIPDDFLRINENVSIHFVSVPTELNGFPTMNIVEECVSNICDYEYLQNKGTVTVVIESTLTPGTAKLLHKMLVEKLMGKHICFVVAPRRDWFERDYRLSDIVRIYGADSVETADFIAPVLRVTTPNLRRASHYTVSEIVKPVENAFRHLDIMLAQQLALSYEDVDIREVLELAGTKWNINTYFPSIGIGGYCIPISSKYILAGEKKEDHLTLLHEVVKFEKEFVNLLCDFILSSGIKNICILGVSYRSDVLMLKGSHLIGVVHRLQELNIKVYLVDPLFDTKSIEQFFRAQSFEINDINMYNFDGVIINNWHRQYDTIISDGILKQLFNCKMLLDNTGKLESYSKEKDLSNYRLIGRISWKNPNLQRD